VQNDWIVATLAIYVFLLGLFAFGRLKLHREASVFLMFGLIVFLIISGKKPIQTHQVMEYSTTLFQYLLGIFLFLTICHLEWSITGIYKLLKVIILFSSLIACFGIIQWLLSLIGIDADLPITSAKYAIEESKSGYERLLHNFRRATSVFVEPRHFGNYLVTPICLTFMVLVDRKLRVLSQRVYGILFIIVLFGGFVLSFSISAYTVLCLSLPITAAILGVRLKRLALLMIEGFGLLALTLVCLQVILNVNLVDYVVTRLNIGSVLRNLDVQAEVFGLSKYLRGCVESVKLASDNYVFGVGLNQVQFFISRDWATVIPPFELLASIGVAGFLCFALFLFQFGRAIRDLERKIPREMQRERGLLKIAQLYILLVIVKSFAMSRYNYGSIMFWFDLSIGGLIYFNVRTRWRSDEPVGESVPAIEVR
jgi:hypothetical protein